MDNAIYPLNGCELDVDPPPAPEPLAVLRKCRDYFIRSEAAYRDSRYQLLARVYAEALRISDSVQGMKLFYEEDYWHGCIHRQPRGIRDVFRDVCAYVTNATDMEERKIASKYAKVLWHLSEEKVPPEHAESAIRCSGGIEKIARSGLCPPPTFDPNSFCDDDEDEKSQLTRGEEDRSQSSIENTEALDDYVKKEGTVLGERVIIEALCESAPDGPVFTIISVDRIADPMDDLSDDDWHRRDLEYVNAARQRPLVLQMPAVRLNKVLRLREGDRATLVVKHVSTSSSGWRVIKAMQIKK
jgi:hypothetical protein